MGKRTNRELSGISRGSGNNRPADSFLLKSEMSRQASSVSIVLMIKSTSGIDSKELERLSSMLQMLFSEQCGCWKCWIDLCCLPIITLTVKGKQVQTMQALGHNNRNTFTESGDCPLLAFHLFVFLNIFENDSKKSEIFWPFYVF